MIDRRRFILALLAVYGCGQEEKPKNRSDASKAAPSASDAQPAQRKARIGFLAEPPADPVMLRTVAEPFRKGLRELGYVEGQNVTLEFRWADGKHERLAGLAAELLRLELDVLVTAFPASALVAKDATDTVPIVAVSVDDPVAMGLAATMSRPGGNITGISAWALELVSKRLQMLRDLVPASRRAGILINPNAWRAPGSIANSRVGAIAGRGDPGIRGARAGRLRRRVRGAGPGSGRWPGRACRRQLLHASRQGSTICACSTGCPQYGAEGTF